MKSMPDRVNPDEFVIRIPQSEGRSRLLDQIDKLGTVEPLPAHPGLMVLHLLKAAKGTPKGRWTKLRKVIGPAGVFPVFVDESLSARLPVGTVVVRFKTPPTAAALAQLALKHGLTVRARNKYAPSQVAFNSPDDIYLPELIEHIEGDTELEAVWPETLSAYQR